MPKVPSRRLLCCGALLVLSMPVAACAQRPDSTRYDAYPLPGTNVAWPKKFLIAPNEFNFRFMTFVLGGAVLVDYANYKQDSLSAEQFDLAQQGKIRDDRFLLSGTFHTKRPAVWQAGILYDIPTSKWLVRQSTITVSVPEIWGYINFGRTKEGMPLDRVMIGYDGWTQERYTMSDAAVPLLADGVKWLGYLPKAHLLWNLGGYVNWLSEGETWSYYKQQAVGRLARVTMDSDTSGKLLHLAGSFHIGKPEHDSLQLKSKPEVSAAPNFVNTGKFPATLGRIAGLEAYYRNGPWLFRSEYSFEWVTSKQTNNPFFHGGDILASWIITGETRPYTTVGGYFRAVSPKRPVFKGGPGAWEAVLRLSYINLDSDTLQGGKFWRVTPMVNWHMTDRARLEFTYGYGILNRFGVRGGTQFFQARLQLQLSKLGVSGD
jgi:phosphate-selective porin OprO/OprP